MTFFAGKVAIVTGASSGIGKAIALGLAAKGARLCMIGRKLESLEGVAEKIQAIGPPPLCYCADVILDADIRQLKASLQQDVETIDILVHGAGVISFGTVEQASLEDFDRQYQTNVRGPYMLTQALLPALKMHRGQIVFINSSAGHCARANVGQYAATKHALKAIADSLREEVNADGVRVLSVFLGRTATPIQAAIHSMEGKAYRPELLLQPEDVAEAVVAALCLPRTAEMTDVHIRPMNKTS